MKFRLSLGAPDDFGQIVSGREKILRNTNLVALGHVKREKDSLPVDVCLPKTSLLKLPNYCLMLVRERKLKQGATRMRTSKKPNPHMTSPPQEFQNK